MRPHVVGREQPPALAALEGDLTRCTAACLGFRRTTLLSKMEKLGISDRRNDEGPTGVDIPSTPPCALTSHRRTLPSPCTGESLIKQKIFLMLGTC